MDDEENKPNIGYYEDLIADLDLKLNVSIKTV